jgi:hypothetical protein
LGLNRWRNLTVEKNDRLGSKSWVGEVKWEDEEPSAAASGSEETAIRKREGMEEWTTEERGPPGGPPKKRRQKGMDVRTSVGAIRVVL